MKAVSKYVILALAVLTSVSASANSYYTWPNIFIFRQDLNSLATPKTDGTSLIPSYYSSFEAEFISKPSLQSPNNDYVFHKAFLRLNGAEFEIPSECLENQIAPPFSISISPYDGLFYMRYRASKIADPSTHIETTISLENFQAAPQSQITCISTEIKFKPGQYIFD